MKIINFFSFFSIPIIILFIIIMGLIEKRNIYDDFLTGAKCGIKVVYNIFPSLIAIFFAVNVLRNSGILDLVVKIILPVTNCLKIPSEIIPLTIIRPISGSASIAVATDIMNKYGVDSKIGIIASTIMGSTETTLYIISLYTRNIGKKNTNFVLYSALIADAVGIIVSILVCNFII